MSSLLRNVFQNVYLAISVQLTNRIIQIYASSYAASVASNNADQIGIVNIRLLLLETILLLLSKESVRQGCLKRVQPNQYNWKMIMKMLWIVFPLCVVMSLPLCWVWIFVLDPPPSQHALSYKYGVLTVVFSCLLDMITEAPNLASKAFYFNKFRNTMTLLYAVIFNVVFIIGLKMNPERVIDAFIGAQIACSVFWVIGFYGFFYIYLYFNVAAELPFTSIKQFFPTFDLTIPNEVWEQAWEMTGAVLLNHLLQDGERYVMTVTNVLSFKHQGIYHLVSALGSLPIRLVLEPLEDNYMMYFARMFQGHKVQDIGEASRREVSKVIHFSCYIIITIGCMLTVFILCYGAPLLYLYGGKNLASHTAFYLLLAQGFIFCFFALQVMTDNFLFGTADPHQLRKYNWILVGVLLVHWLSSWFLSSILGAPGLTLATCLCLCIRILWGLWHMKSVFENSSLTTMSGLIPRKETCIIFAIYLIISLVFKYTIKSNEVIQCIVGAVLFVISCIVAITSDPELTDFARSLIQQEEPHQH